MLPAGSSGCLPPGRDIVPPACAEMCDLACAECIAVSLCGRLSPAAENHEMSAQRQLGLQFMSPYPHGRTHRAQQNTQHQLLQLLLFSYLSETEPLSLAELMLDRFAALQYTNDCPL